MKKIVILMLLVGMVSIGAHAQGEIIGALTYQISFPTGDTNDFVSRANWFGLGLEGRKFVMVRKGDRLQKVDVKLGIEGEDRVEILEGLEEGQIIEGL